jgi:predicted small metal-binding protein
MAKVINCECGYVVRGADDDELIRNAEEHIRQDHPDLVGKMSRDDLLALAEEA